jgi:REP element-mobilizing transposase RayT
MARRIRLDAPGAIHHVMVRGLDGMQIFRDADDYHDFVGRMVRVFIAECAPCLGWVLMPNHGHFLMRTDEGGLARIMRRLNTGYAQRFNRRWSRRGYLFQNRFASRRATSDPDLMVLVRYVHRNPLRAGLVRSLAELEGFPWCSYGALMGRRPPLPFEAVADALELFATDVVVARERVRRWMDAPGADLAQTGAPALPAMAAATRVTDLELEGTVGLEALLAAARSHYCVGEEDLASGRKKPGLVRVRAVVAYWAVARLRIPCAAVAQALGISASTVSASVDRGRELARIDGFRPL